MLLSVAPNNLNKIIKKKAITMNIMLFNQNFSVCFLVNGNNSFLLSNDNSKSPKIVVINSEIGFPIKAKRKVVEK
jgi:hypothetical protein